VWTQMTAIPGPNPLQTSHIASQGAPELTQGGKTPIGIIQGFDFCLKMLS
jgi:hypothetical protein